MLSAEELASADADALPQNATVTELVGHILESGCLNVPTDTTELQLDNGPTELVPTADGEADFTDPRFGVDGARLNYGVTAVLALSPTSPDETIVVVPSSHNSTLQCPDLRQWDAELRELHSSSTDDLGVTVPVPLQPGDLLLAAATLMQSVRGSPRGLFKFECKSELPGARGSQANPKVLPSVTPAGSFPSAGLPEAPPLPDGLAEPAWLSELTEAEKAVVGARTVGELSKVVMSDGPAPHRSNAVILLRPADSVRGQESGRGPNPGPPLTHRAATLSFSHRRFLPAPRRRGATRPKSTPGISGTKFG